ncbi:TetR family transcriptional regulator [Falsiroseomonas selenitidurans]|uniref:TetR/AcrR family transcriptional regulator n=1 Tax=Falsiroseomonas selenitidurans TaxID=2716335 RepID=A0ABX1E4V5_9PROT|nr:TetR family transcriptional regulator [Falsiroseomonas selenitidurans]NKC32210.1 TetR/AcrR family transcriptional regulator [Falsiroseomonas selenitidurans]
MPEAPATAEPAALRMLDAAEALIRRHGPAKATVVDVARALGMSHGNVYRHFPSKAALREAVVARWLHAVVEPLEPIVTGPEEAPARLARYIRTLAGLKRQKVLGDPELFAAYHLLAEEHRDAVAAHVATLRQHVATILRQGQAAGDWRVPDPDATAQLLLEATMRFHHPHLVREQAADETAPARLEALLALLVKGLGPA